MSEKIFEIHLKIVLGAFLFVVSHPVLVIVIFTLIVASILYFDFFQFKKSSYFAITKNSYFQVKFDKGKLGEYHIYKHLKKLEKDNARFLFNAYIPKVNGGTTEIDVLMITSKGIFVFESKNYSGWIFGNETQKYWTQVLPEGRGKSCKEKFFNPIIQNTGHIKNLKNLIGEDTPIHSIIAFSNRCTFKKVYINSADVEVVHRYEVLKTVKKVMENIQSEILNYEMIQEIYDKLYEYTQVSSETKQQHIENINSKR